MDSTIAFAYQPSIALLKINTMEFDWITDIKENDKIFKQLSKVNDFDYYYINEINIIFADSLRFPEYIFLKNNIQLE